MDEEALALAGKSKGKVKCFICYKQGHFASQCPDKKKKSNTQMAGSVEVDEFSRNFDEEFCLIACMASTTGSNIWYIDSVASSHMTGHKRFLQRLAGGWNRDPR